MSAPAYFYGCVVLLCAGAAAGCAAHDGAVGALGFGIMGIVAAALGANNWKD